MRGKRWTEEEVSLLRTIYNQKLTLKEVSIRIGHPLRSTVHKAFELGLKRNFWFFEKSWKPEEDSIMTRIYPSSSREEILSALPHRAWHTVIQRAHHLGVQRLELARMKDILISWDVESISDVEKAYLAGILDGEGSIGISRYQHPQSKVPHYVTYFSIANTSEELMEWLEEKIFKKISIKRKIKPRKSGFGKKPCYQITIGTKKVYLLLKTILPYLVIKKKRAEKVIEFAEQRFLKPRKVPYSERELELYEECRRLNESQRNT